MLRTPIDITICGKEVVLSHVNLHYAFPSAFEDGFKPFADSMELKIHAKSEVLEELANHFAILIDEELGKKKNE